MTTTPATPSALQPLTPRLRRRAVAALLLAPLLAGVALTGCGGSDSENATAADAGAGGSAPREESSRSGGSDSLVAEDKAAAGDGTAAGGGTVATQRTSARVLPAGRDIVYRGSITVRVADVGRALARAEALALDVDGVVFDEQTSTEPGRHGFSQATLTLRVPPTQFAATLDALGRLGKQLSRTKSAQDVTTEVADVDSRVRSQERSVARVRALLGRAETIGEVVQVEAELARREADLESLQAQLARLEDVTDMATIEATLVSRPVPPTPVTEENDLGFVSGFRGGWDAFVGIVLVGLTVLGALVPFAVTVALLGIPAYVLLRRRQQRPAAGPAS